MQWHVQGLLIGNGWVSPAEQYESYLPFAYKEGLVKKDSPTAARLETQQSVCLTMLGTPAAKDQLEVEDCENVLRDLLDLTANPDNGCYNMYDVRLRDEYPSCGMNWPVDLANMKPYLRRPDVVAALHINPDKKSGWEECSGAVSSTFTARNSVPSVQLLPDLIESGLPVLLFSGDKDLICNHIGTEKLIRNMKWNGGTGFETSPGVWAPRHEWTFEGEPTGVYQTARNLTYVLIYNASHMVPYDIPRQSRDMLDRFMQVDIANIGGKPADSRIDGEKVPSTTVGGHPNSTAAEEEERQKMNEAEWQAYAKSGETVLVVVIIGVSVWGFLIWRSRRRHSRYRGLSNGSVLGRLYKHSAAADVESAREFDESELDRLDPVDRNYEQEEAPHFAVGIDSDEEDSHHRTPTARSELEKPLVPGSDEEDHS